MKYPLNKLLELSAKGSKVEIKEYIFIQNQKYISSSLKEQKAILSQRLFGNPSIDLTLFQSPFKKGVSVEINFNVEKVLNTLQKS